MRGREGKLEASRRSRVEPGCCFSRYVRGMIIEDQLDRGAGRISGVETLEEFDELPAAVAVSDQRMDLAGKQVDSGQQAQRAMTFVLVIPREGRVDAGLGRQIGCGGCDGLDSRLLVVGNDRHSLDGFARLGGGSLQNLDLAINAQNLGHLLLELGIATFQIVAHLVRLDFLLAEDLAHRALNPCDKAKEHGYPHELWTTRLLARHAREHGPAAGHECLANLVQGTVCKILGQEEIKPHKVRYYLERRDAEFEQKMAEVLCVYREVQVLKKAAARSNKPRKP